MTAERPCPVHGRPARPPRADWYRAYGGLAWLALRRQVLLEEPWCRACVAAGRPSYASEVDHIVPKRAGGSDARANLQALCKPCHSRKTASEVRRVAAGG